VPAASAARRSAAGEAVAAAGRANQAVRVEVVHQPVVASPVVRQLEQGEVHGAGSETSAGAASVDVSPVSWREKADHRNDYMSLFYIARTGCQWRFLPHDFPDHDSARYWFDR
jgi:hypothetical protein